MAPSRVNTGALVRALLIPDGNHGEALHCHYNPSTMTLAKSARWKFDRNRNAATTPPPEFIGTDPRTLTMDLLFDAYEGQPGSVVTAITKLMTWTCATSQSRAKDKPQPPMLILQWGKQTYGPGFLKSMSAKYTLFDASGDPLRATVTVTLSEVPVEPPGNNPTSGGVAGRRAAVFKAGDSLPSLAYREYGDANLWRAIAEANDIDNPRQIRPGRSLLVPPLAEAGRLTGAGRA